MNSLSLSLSLSYGKIKKMAVWKFAFVSEHLNTDQSQLTKCFALVACFGCRSLGDSSCCDRQARAACVQRFTLCQQATIETTRRDHSIIACSRQIYMGVVLRAHPVCGEPRI